MNKKAIPYIIGLPNLGVGLLWAMNMTLIPMLVATFGVSNAKSALLISMGAFTGIFVQYLAGILSDRSKFKMGKRKPFMLIGSLLTTVFMCFMPFAKSYTLLFLFSFLFYFSLNFYQGPYYSLLPEVVPDNKLGLANGFARFISVLGAAFIFITGTAFWNSKSTLNISHSLPFFIGAILGLVTLLITFFFIKEDTTKYKKPTKISFDFVKYPSVMKLFIAIFFIYLCNGCITPFFVKYIRYIRLGSNALSTSFIANPANKALIASSDNMASTALLLLTASGALFAYPIGILSDKIERRKVMLLGTVIFAISLFIAIFIKSSISFYVIMAIMGIGFIAVQVTSYSILAEIVPPERLGEFMGIFNAFVSLSQFVANNAMGNMLDKFGYKVLFPTACTVMVIACIIIATAKFNKYKVSEKTLNA